MLPRVIIAISYKILLLLAIDSTQKIVKMLFYFVCPGIMFTVMFKNAVYLLPVHGKLKKVNLVDATTVWFV